MITTTDTSKRRIIIESENNNNNRTIQMMNTDEITITTTTTTTSNAEKAQKATTAVNNSSNTTNTINDYRLWDNSRVSRKKIYRNYQKYQREHPNQNRTLVISMGNFRGGEETWSSLVRNVLDPNMADLALLVPENDTVAKQSSLYRERAKYKWTFHDYGKGNWSDAIDLIPGDGFHKIWRDLAAQQYVFVKKVKENINRDMPSIFGAANKDHPGSGAIIFMLRFFLQQHIIENDLLQQYERFVVTRTDHYYSCLSPVNSFPINRRNVFVPTGELYGGVTDRHLIVGNQDVMDAIDVYPTYFRTKWIQERNMFMNSEQLLKQVWREKKLHIRRFPRTMFLAHLMGTDVATWDQPKKKVEGTTQSNLYCKYQTEYDMAQEYCNKNQTNKQ